jgi:hypothetical protein
VGNVFAFVGSDIQGRYQRMRGYDVFHPIGFDALGLPAENAAIKDGRHPAERTRENIDAFRADMKKFGCSFDWAREISTCDPEYYRWNQWFFLKMLERGLAYRSQALVNWCPLCATVRPIVFRAAEPDARRPVAIRNFPVNLSKAAIRTRVVEELPAAEFGEKIEEARILVSAGRGCGDPSNLDLVRRLAHRLGGTLAGSRAIVELGWIPHTLQVGQSGTTVGPDLYVAVGISGAVQHIVGMSSSKKIIAINKDPDAPIFKIADIGVVGDAQAILPKLLDQLKSQ